MKERIYTIELNDAFDADTECPICTFLELEEQKRIDYTVGASMMEPDCREETNQKGFCRRHMAKILETPNKLSVALMLETHMDAVLKQLNDGKSALPTPKRRMFQKADALKEAVLLQADTLSNINQSCAVCDWLFSTLSHFMENLFYLYETEPEFQKKVLACKGFCVPHFELLLRSAVKYQKDQKLSDFVNAMYDIQTAQFARVKDDLSWFGKKFDYRYRDADWKNSKDALPRSAQKLISHP